MKATYISSIEHLKRGSSAISRRFNRAKAALVVGAVGAITGVAAKAADGDFEGLSSVSTQVTSWSTDIKAILGIAFGVVVVVVAFKLGKRFLNKAA